MRILAVLGLLLSACSSCSGPDRAAARTDNVLTTHADQNEYASETARRIWGSTVRLEVYCEGEAGPSGWGSGVTISRRHVLTARHVIDCDNKAKLEGVIVHLDDGQRIPMSLDVLPASDGVDAARLVVDGIQRFDWFARPALYSPARWQTVCVLASDIEMGELYPKCGYVSRGGHATLRVSIHVVPGNSGAAVWDLSGNVVALVSRGRWASNGEFVLLAQRLNPSPELLLPADHPDLR